ncbi:granulysin isoform X2 [Pteropus medius]|uniref:granulysin isoform X2 n=1 Tax=Pteropus vampyrus TaxID=132908 RepID=UPI00196B668A|nr:granulysin isoform X2 [Pteropus giganteus]
MASWSLLLLALELLATPGLAFTHLTPEHHDLVMADLHDGEQFCQSLAQEGLQGDLLITREGMSINCWSCTKIIQKLEKMVGKQPDKHRPGCVPSVQQDEVADRPLQEDHEDVSSSHLQRHHGWQNTQ